MDKKSFFSKWLYASKLKSWPKILVPFILGNALGIRITEKPYWSLLLLGGVATILGTVFIVLMNDWGDQKVDKIKREMFPDGCSPKTIPDNILSARALLIGGIFAGTCSFSIIVYLGMTHLNRPLTSHFALLSCLIFIIYTLPPVKLNYRGGGEFLETLGVGLILPLFMVYLQSGVLIETSTLFLLIPYAIFSLTSAIASGFSDEESDRAGGKHTFVTMMGNTKSHEVLNIIFVLGGAVSLILALWLADYVMQFGVLVAQIPLWINYFKMRRLKGKAVTNAFKEQAIFKNYLHQSIWGYGLILSGVVILKWMILYF